MRWTRGSASWTSGVWLIMHHTGGHAALHPGPGVCGRAGPGHGPLAALEASYSIHRTPYIIHHTSYTIHHTSYIIHHASYIMHHTPYIIHDLSWPWRRFFPSPSPSSSSSSSWEAPLPITGGPAPTLPLAWLPVASGPTASTHRLQQQVPCAECISWRCLRL